MSGKSKIAYVLLATTGLFVFNPSLATSIFHIDQSLSAEEMPLDPSAADGLNALTGAATSPDSSISENGNNLSPKRDYAGLAPATNDTTTVKKDYAPGENPFQPANQSIS